MLVRSISSDDTSLVPAEALAKAKGRPFTLASMLRKMNC